MYLIFSLIIQFTTPSRSSGVVAVASAPSSLSLECLSRLAGRHPTSVERYPCSSVPAAAAVVPVSYPASYHPAVVADLGSAAVDPVYPDLPSCPRSDPDFDLGLDPDFDFGVFACGVWFASAFAGGVGVVGGVGFASAFTGGVFQFGFFVFVLPS